MPVVGVCPSTTSRCESVSDAVTDTHGPPCTQVHSGGSGRNTTMDTTHGITLTRERLVALVALFLLLLTGLLVDGSQAGWVDAATARVPITAGTLQVKVNGQETYTFADGSGVLGNLSAGATATDRLDIRVAGTFTADLSYTVAGMGVSAPAVSGVDYRLLRCTDATCTDTSVLVEWRPLVDESIPAANFVVGVPAESTVHTLLEVRGTDDLVQGSTFSPVLRFTGTQAVTP